MDINNLNKKLLAEQKTNEEICNNLNYFSQKTKKVRIKSTNYIRIKYYIIKGLIEKQFDWGIDREWTHQKGCHPEIEGFLKVHNT